LQIEFKEIRLPIVLVLGPFAAALTQNYFWFPEFLIWCSRAPEKVRDF